MERYVLTRKEVRPRTSGRKIERPIVLGDLERAFVGLMFDKRYSRQMRQQLGRLAVWFDEAHISGLTKMSRGERVGSAEFLEQLEKWLAGQYRIAAAPANHL
jgi:hypothetical protein